jgi:hypothetical protein
MALRRYAHLTEGIRERWAWVLNAPILRLKRGDARPSTGRSWPRGFVLGFVAVVLVVYRAFVATAMPIQITLEGRCMDVRQRRRPGAVHGFEARPARRVA